jgi:histidinol-phosphate/aromatic aminotransferase/cobyric acid decarboxylase-like protein
MGDRPTTLVAPAAHGGLLGEELAALGVRANDVLDASVNVNPYGPCPSVRRAIAAAAIDRYPEPRATPARRALAERGGIDARRVVLGNGAVDLLWTLARATLCPGDRVVTVEPAFSEMRSAAVCAGASIVEHRTRPEDHFAVDLGALDRHLREVRPRLLYACTPSNPAGVCVPLPALAELAARHRGTLFVVDVSFLSMSTRHAEADLSPDEGVCWVRSLTKDHALPGLRVGYGVTTIELAERLEAHRPPWSVNALAQAAAIATTTDEARGFVAGTRTRWLEDRVALTQALEDLGLRAHPSETVYVLADLDRHAGDVDRDGEGPDGGATALRQRLLRDHGVLVRDATSFGLPRHIRVAARPSRDLTRLLHALLSELPR